MPRRIQTSDGAEALSMNNLLRSPEGYGWVRGCGVTIGGSGSNVEVDVASGLVRHDGELVNVSQTTVTLPDGDPQYPRKDLVYVDRNGDVKVRQGKAAEAKPDGKVRGQTWQPAPPDSAGLDAVPLAFVWVPSGATSTGDLDPRDKLDARVASKSVAAIPTRSTDPPDDELLQTRWWYNNTDDALRAYFHDVREVHSIDTTLDRALGAPTEQVVETFDDSIKGNWDTSGSTYTYVSSSFEGSNAAEWSSGSTTRDYSLPGDGLSYYPEPGDQVALAVYVDSGFQKAYVGFGKDQDDPNPDYRVWLEEDGTLEIIHADTDNGLTQLGSASASISAGNWYILEGDYDGGGEGIHPGRVWSTSGGSRDTKLAEISSPTKDTSHRGRGISVGIQGDGRLDRYAVTPDGA